jgi:uncharacterized protein YchJ
LYYRIDVGRFSQFFDFFGRIGGQWIVLDIPIANKMRVGNIACGSTKKLNYFLIPK